ncbi:MAG: AraC family transcriptional regulator [Flavobacterium sp.]
MAGFVLFMANDFIKGFVHLPYKVLDMNTKFVFLLLPEIHLMDLAGPDQAIHEAIFFGADFEIEYCNVTDGITTAAGLPIGKTKHFSEIEVRTGDFVVIPGANASYLASPEFKKQKPLFSWLTGLHLKGINLCSICTGAFALAECGLLDDNNCTTHFKRTRQLQESYPKAKVIENILFTDQNGIYTSAGIASGIDLTLHIIEKLKGSHLAHLVARELVVYNRRGGNSAQDSECCSTGTISIPVCTRHRTGSWKTSISEPISNIWRKSQA